MRKDLSPFAKKNDMVNAADGYKSTLSIVIMHSQVKLRNILNSSRQEFQESTENVSFGKLENLLTEYFKQIMAQRKTTYTSCKMEPFDVKEWKENSMIIMMYFPLSLKQS